MLQKVTPKPRWIYNTAHWSVRDVDDLEHYAERWLGIRGLLIKVSLQLVGRRAFEGDQWAKNIRLDLTSEAIEDIAADKADLFIELEWPEYDDG